MKVKAFLLCICFAVIGVTLMAQKTITGAVTDDNGEPLVGVNVLEQGTLNGAVTDLDGKYTLDVAGDGAILIFSYTGYESQVENINGRTTIDLILRQSIELLEEVVVSALGFKQKKDEMGSTYSTIRSEDVVRSGEAGLLNGLAGKASGVRVARSNGDPGAGSTIQIRGANTITGSSDPLIILDGVPISNSTIYGGGNSISGGRDAGTSQQSRLNDINPNDIESVQVLKGASAASLWGSRAANGVVVITTKKGKAGKPTISFSSTYSIDEINRRHPLQNTYGNGTDGEFRVNNRDSWGDKIADRAGGQDEFNTNGARFEAADGTIYYPVTKKNSRETFNEENFDAVFKNGYFLQNDLAISGGNDKATFFFSFGSLDQEGIIRKSFYDRRNLRLNNTIRFNDWLSMSSNAGYTYSKSNRIQQSSNVSGLYLGLLRTPPDFDIRDYIGTYYTSSGQAFPNRHRSYRRYLGENANPTYNNPLWTTDQQKNLTTVNRFIMSSELNIDPLSWLRFTLRGGIDSYSDDRIYFFPIGSAGDRSPGVFQEDIIGERELNFDAFAKANFKLSSNIGLGATIGWNLNDRQRRTNYANLTGFQVFSDLETTALNTANEATSINNGKRYIRSNRGYGILAFDFSDQVFVNISGSMEAASSVKGSFFYPSTDVAWQFTKLAGLKNNPVLSFGKLRASWGKVGVQPQPHRFQTLADGGFSVSTYSDALDISLFGGGYRTGTAKGNADLKPEIKTEWEIGADLRFLRDKLGLSMTYYQNEIVDLLFNVPTAPSTGFIEEYTNAGSMENKGFEAELDYNLIQRKNFNINLYANINRNKNEVTDLKGTESVDLTTQSISSRAVQGYPLGVLWASKSKRNSDGSLFLNDFGFPEVDDKLGVIGDPNPDWRGGAGLKLNWKNFDLNVLFEHNQGGVFADRTRVVLYAIGTHADVGNEVTLTKDLKNIQGTVIPAGTTVRGNIGNFGAGDVLLDQAWYTTIGGGLGAGLLYDLLMSSGTWTRLREVSLSYNWRSPWLQQKAKLSAVQFSVTGRNLVLWSDVLGIDPETNQFGVLNGFGIEYFTNPGTRSILFSIKVTY